MLRELHTANWRSLEDLTVTFDRLTAIVGPNGAGKTAIIAAIDFLLGERWPSMNGLAVPQDFTSFDQKRALKIVVTFDEPLHVPDAMTGTKEVWGLGFKCEPYKKSGKWGSAGSLHDTQAVLDAKGNQLTVARTKPSAAKKPEFERVSLSGALRDQARVLLIGDRRYLAAHSAGRRGSVLSKLLELARREFDADKDGIRSNFRDHYSEALAAVRAGELANVEGAISETARRMLGFLGSDALDDLSVEFDFTDPSSPFSSLMIVAKEGDLRVPADTLGLGIQSAIVVGIFDALRQQRANVGTVVIEEPEMYLHPQAQRFFYRLLCDMADSGQCQVIYTTHSPIFADMLRFRGVRLIRKQSGQPSTVDWVDQDEDHVYLQLQLDREKLSLYFDTASSEALFASRVLLVEGHGDRLAAMHVAERQGLDLNAEGLSIVACGGKAAIPFFARTCRALKIPFVVLHDEDVHREDCAELAKWQVEENARSPAQNTEIRSAAGDAAEIFTLRPSLEHVLGVGRSATDKPRLVLQALSERETTDLPQPLVEAVDALGRAA